MIWPWQRWPNADGQELARCTGLVAAMRNDLLAHREQLHAHADAMNTLLLDIQKRLRHLERLLERRD